ncbi:MAG: hypothetical protein ACOC29_02720, partial [Candidatus Sumerlaeota bacterium]
MRRSMLSMVMICVVAFASAREARQPSVPEESADGVFLRQLLEHFPQTRSSSPPRFAVPAKLVRDYVRYEMQFIFKGEKSVDRLVRERLTIRPTIEAKPIIVERDMRVTVLDASPLLPARLKLFPESTVFNSVKVNGTSVSPIPRDGWYEIGLPDEGDYHITAETVHAPRGDAARAQFSLEHASFAVATVEINTRLELDVRVEQQPGRLVGMQREGTRGILPLGGGESTTIVWQAPQFETMRTGTVSMRPNVAWLVGERTLSANARLDLRMLGGAAEELVLFLPAGSEQVELRGPDLREFRQDGNRLQVFFRGAVSGASSLDLTFTCPRPSGETFLLPRIETAGGRGDSGGWLIVSNDTPGILLENSVAGLEAAELSQADASVRGLSWANPVHVYRDESRSGSARFDLLLAAPFPLVDTIADKADIQMVVRPDGSEMTRVRWSMRNDRAQYMRLRMPEGAKILSLSVEEKSARPVYDGGVILIPLAKSIQTLERLLSFPIELVYVRQADTLEGMEDYAVDLPELVDVSTARIELELYLPEDYELEWVRSALRRKIEESAPGAEGFTIGYGQTDAPSPAPLMTRPLRPESSLSTSYYRLGYEAYKSNRFSEAEQYLEKAAANAPADAESKDEVAALLGTIKATAGDGGAATTKSSKAKQAVVRQSLEASNVQQMAQQADFEREGRELLQEGRREEALGKLRQSRVLGKELQKRGAKGAPQAEVDELEELEDLEEQTQRGRELREKLADAQSQAQDLLDPELSGQNQDRPAQVDESIRAFNRVLEQEAARENVDVRETRNLAFGFDFDAKDAASAPSVRSVEDIAAENKRLEQQAEVLKRAVEAARKPQTEEPSIQPTPRPTPAPSPGWRYQYDGRTKDELESVKKQAEQLNQRLQTQTRGDGRLQDDGDDNAIRVFNVEVDDKSESIRTLERAVRGLSAEVESPEGEPEILKETRRELDEARKQMDELEEMRRRTDVLSADISDVLD